MKKIIFILAILPFFASCSDMLESDSSRQAFDPELNQKTDSVFYALGILQGMQQLADQYVFQGEMRGDLVTTTAYTDNNLRQLADFSATTACKYDSAYVYYRVINNCNYYIAHRDTTLRTGATNVVINEYAAVKAIRAWAYLQLVRNYGKVPFFTEPLVTISQINGSHFPELDIQGITQELAPDLARYSGLAVPSYNATNYSIGSTNAGQAKTIDFRRCFIPVDIILGDLYLEAGDYANAAKYLANYIITQPMEQNAVLATFSSSFGNRRNSLDVNLPQDWGSQSSTSPSYANIFDRNSTIDIISYIPMAVNSQQGQTTEVPVSFGYNYYRVPGTGEETYIEEIQIVPSEYYQLTADSAWYYYNRNVAGGFPYQYKGAVQFGDMRRNAVLRTSNDLEQADMVWVDKYKAGNIYLYRQSTVMLHLAEALNRMGYPDAAFGMLKEGIVPHLVDTANVYITGATRQLLTTTIPFFSDENASKFPTPTSLASMSLAYGIHQRGAGYTYDGAYYGSSPYQFADIVGGKMKELAEQYPELAQRLAAGTTTKNDTINAMEDLLCDEMAMELCFEGTRFYDLARLARHKNAEALYGSNCGSLWFSRKLQRNNPVKDLSDSNNWYLPFR